MDLKKILVATDLSARSDRAVLRAVKLAKEFQSQLIIVHIIDGDMPRGIIDDAKKSAKEEIDLCLKNKVQTLKPQIKISIGNPYVEILKIASEEDVDLVVIGLHRHTLDEQSMVGSVISRLMRLSHKPLLIVKDRYESSYTKVLSALDFDNHSKKSLKTALRLFGDAKFYLLNTYQVPFLGFMGKSGDIEQQVIDDSTEDLNEAINDVLQDINNDKKEKRSFEIDKIIKKGDIIDVLQEEVKYVKPQLLVLGTHGGRTGISRMAVPSTTETILVNPPCDVFVVS